MRIICFPHFYYLSEVSRLVEMGLALRRLEQDVVFFSHGGTYEHVAREAGFEVLAVSPEMSKERAEEYMAFNRGEKGNPFRDSFFTYEELQAYVPSEADAFRQARADAGLILSKWDINRCSLGRALEQLLSDSRLRENMLRLKSLQDKVDGPAVAAREIVKFLGASNGSKEVAK